MFGEKRAGSYEMSLVDRYRWPQVGGVLAIDGGGALALAHRRTSKLEMLSVSNLLGLLVHQHEEYEDPG